MQHYEKVSNFDLVNFEKLNPEEKVAVQAAIEAQKNSTDKKWRVGAAAVSSEGTMVAIHNEVPGSKGHAERNVLTRLYRSIGPGIEKKLKILAIAGAREGEQVIRKDVPYDSNAPMNDIEWMRPCPKCLEFIHDRTANVSDVEILAVADTGQVIRTSLRSLLPAPHTSFQIPVRFDGESFTFPTDEENGK